MIRQVKTKYGRVDPVMKSAAFVLGFNEVRKGKPLNYEAFVDVNEQWRYERGRHFALIFTGTLKNGARLTRPARDAFCAAIKARIIF